jgi:hypothetical protein
VQRSSQQKRNPPLSQRDKRQRLPPLKGNAECFTSLWRWKNQGGTTAMRISRRRPLSMDGGAFLLAKSTDR